MLNFPETDFLQDLQLLARFIDSSGKTELPGRLRLPAVAQVLLHILRRGEATASDLSSLGFSTSTVYRALSLLGDLGLVEPTGVIRRTNPDGAGKPAALWRLGS